MPGSGDHHPGPPPPPPPPPDQWGGWWHDVRIGPREVYDAVTGLRETMWQLVNSVQSTRVDVDDHETRIRQVEEHRVGTRLSKLEEQLAAVQARMFPLPVLACLFSAGALVLTVVQMKG